MSDDDQSVDHELPQVNEDVDNEQEETNDQDDNAEVEGGDAANDGDDDMIEIDPAEFQKELQLKIREILHAGSVEDLNLNVVKQHLREEYGKEAVKQYKDYIKNLVIEEANALAAAANEADATLENEDNVDEYQPQKEDDDDYQESTARKPKRRSTTSIPKKGKAKSSSKQRVGPVGPRSGYLLFSQSRRESLKSENPDSSFGDISKLIAAEWKELGDDDKSEWLARADDDKQRYKREMAELKERDPEEYERAVEETNKPTKRKKKRASSDGDDEPSDVRRAKKKKVADDSGGEEGEEKKELSYFDSVVAKLKTRRQTKSAYQEDDAAEMCKRFLGRMEVAARKDATAIKNNVPAVNKVSMLTEVESQVGKKEVADRLIESGLLKVVNEWLALLPDGSLPNIRMRSSLYRLLDALPVTEMDLERSGGLGRTLMQHWKHEDETPENKKFLGAMIEKWMRPMMGLKTGYKHLEDIERGRSLDIQRRNAALVPVRTPTINTGRARIPEPASFDYAIRPVGVERDSDAEEEERKMRVREDEDSRRVKMSKRLDRMKKSANVSSKARYRVDISGSKLGMLK